MSCRQAQDTAEQHAKAAEASVQALKDSGADCAAQLSASNQVCTSPSVSLPCAS